MDNFAVSWILVNIVSLCSLVNCQQNVIRFQSEEIKEIVDTHNDLRRSIQYAANMRELTWNEAVAFAASEWGTRCEYVSRPDNQWGQNMNYFYGHDYHNGSMDLFRDSFRAWQNETRHYDYRRYLYCGSKHVCSYVQLIAADVQEVGCAIVKCPKLQLQAPPDVQQHAKLLVCFYTPWVNILDSEVFIPEKRCSACPAGTTCVDNLCSARFYQPGSRTIPIGSPGIKIDSISGAGERSGSDVVVEPTKSHKKHLNTEEVSVARGTGHDGHQDRRRGGRHRDRGDRKPGRTVGSHNTFENSGIEQDNRVYQEHRRNPDSYAVQTNKETVVVYTPNNRVIPFPGKQDRRNIRRIEKFEDKVEKDLEEKQERIIHSLELIANNITVTNITSQSRSSRSELTGEEQFFTISAHNLLRRESGAKDLAWSSHLERWAKYVIRCETEYPGPITCYTNFGKAETGQEIYNVVYQWGGEGDDMNRPLRYGCRTPYDKSLCNHSFIIRNKSLTQMACAAKNCGPQRQLTCVYSAG